MKKSVLILAILFILPTFLAIEVTFSKETYQPQELFQAEITGNFISLTKDNIHIYSEDKAHPEPLIKDLTKQDNIYYFYALLPKEPGNLSLRIEDVEYLERGKVKEDPIVRPLTTILEEESDLFINPGFLIPNQDFEINVMSILGNTELIATFEATGEEKTISLIEQVEETLKFNLPTLPPGKSNLKVNDYNIPVFLLQKVELTNEIIFLPHIIEGTIIPNSDYHFSVLIRNPGITNLENIQFTSDLNTKFSPETIVLLEPNQSAFINLTITVEKAEEPISGLIEATIANNKYYLPVEFGITNNQTEVEVKDATNTPSNAGDGNSNLLSCSQLGTICLDGQVCDGDSIDSFEGSCCLTTCKEKETTSNSTLIGVVLIVILLILVAYVVRKARRKKNQKSADQILEEKKEKYTKRMKGKKVDGKLDSV